MSLQWRLLQTLISNRPLQLLSVAAWQKEHAASRSNSTKTFSTQMKQLSPMSELITPSANFQSQPWNLKSNKCSKSEEEECSTILPFIKTMFWLKQTIQEFQLDHKSLLSKQWRSTWLKFVSNHQCKEQKEVFQDHQSTCISWVLWLQHVTPASSPTTMSLTRTLSSLVVFVEDNQVSAFHWRLFQWCIPSTTIMLDQADISHKIWEALRLMLHFIHSFHENGKLF